MLAQALTRGSVPDCCRFVAVTAVARDPPAVANVDSSEPERHAISDPHVRRRLRGVPDGSPAELADRMTTRARQMLAEVRTEHG